MGSKDPGDREREFRSAIERSVLERRRERGARPWLRRIESLFFKAMSFSTNRGCAWRVAIVCFVGFFVFIFGYFVKLTDAYDCSLGEARRSPVVIAELGEPVEAGFFAWIYGYSQEGSVTDTAFRTSLAGPKGGGTLRVQWYRSPVGSSLYMELEKGGRKTVVYSGVIPCR